MIPLQRPCNNCVHFFKYAAAGSVQVLLLKKNSVINGSAVSFFIFELSVLKKSIGIDVLVFAHIAVNNVDQQAVPFSVLQCSNTI